MRVAAWARHDELTIRAVRMVEGFRVGSSVQFFMKELPL
jgi:hypothetical protein